MLFICLDYKKVNYYCSATDKLISRARQLVDVKKDDGFAALHLAAFNGHRAVVESLVTDGKATLDLVTYRKQTPLMLAVSQVIVLVFFCYCLVISSSNYFICIRVLVNS